VKVEGRKCPDWKKLELEDGTSLSDIIECYNFDKRKVKKKHRERWCDDVCHVSFEHLHPFRDGNGRVGRILYNWQRLKLGLPIHVIKYEDRWEYYNWFK
jgi:hypothetical protein